MEPFCLIAQDLGTPVESLLQALHLPAQLPAEKDLLLIEIPCWKFIHKVAVREACAVFGLMASDKKSWTELSTLQPLFKDCQNLYELLKRLVFFAPLQSKTSRFAILEEDDFIWFVDHRTRLLAEEKCIQTELYTLLGMIQLVQTAAGKNWRPSEIHLTIRHSIEIAYARQLNPSRLLFSQPFMKIAIPRSLLPLPLSKSVTNNQQATVDIDAYKPMPDSFTGLLTAAIIPYLGMDCLNKKLIANLVDMSPRTLQRRLDQTSSSYLSILNQARFIQAQTLLKASNLPLLDISLMLGYQNASSFTRAFRRWSGVTPKAFRGLFQEPHYGGEYSANKNCQAT